jgi:hypothetical protein
MSRDIYELERWANAHPWRAFIAGLLLVLNVAALLRYVTEHFAMWITGT